MVGFSVTAILIKDILLHQQYYPWNLLNSGHPCLSAPLDACCFFAHPSLPHREGKTDEQQAHKNYFLPHNCSFSLFARVLVSYARQNGQRFFSSLTALISVLLCPTFFSQIRQRIGFTLAVHSIHTIVIAVYAALLAFRVFPQRYLPPILLRFAASRFSRISLIGT